MPATRGSMPAVGSSIRNSTGSCIRLRAISSWRRWPPLNAPAAPRLDAGGGLVDQEQHGIVHQAARHLELALLPAAQRAGRLAAPLPQHRKLLASLLDEIVDPAALALVAPSTETQIHLDAQARKDARTLRQGEDAR